MPIGQAAANEQIYVLDQWMNPVAEKVVGELYIGGEGLAQGYWERRELTAERFVAGPVRWKQRVGGCTGRETWEGIWRTGDIEFLGRRDEQVKFHGYRVELNEIRATLNRHGEVRDSVVVITKDESGLDVMVAYYVARHAIEAGVLRAHLEEHLIRETVPNFFVHLKKIPLTLNGKVNLKALPGVKEIRQQTADSVAPWRRTDSGGRNCRWYVERCVEAAPGRRGRKLFRVGRTLAVGHASALAHA